MKEGFYTTMGALVAQGMVEAGERWWNAGHGIGHPIALLLAVAAWGLYRSRR